MNLTDKQKAKVVEMALSETHICEQYVPSEKHPKARRCHRNAAWLSLVGSALCTQHAAKSTRSKKSTHITHMKTGFAATNAKEVREYARSAISKG
jgi:hypothetical protein